MIKKILLLTTLAVASITLVSVGVVSLFANEQYKVTAGGDTNDYAISFTASDVTAGDYDGDAWVRPFSLRKENCLVGNYGLSSMDYDGNTSGTYYYGSNENLTFGGSHILEISACNYESFNIEFALIERAQIDLDNSWVVYTENGVTTSEKFHSNGKKDNKNCYCVSLDTYSNYGKSYSIDSVLLTFACAK